MLQSIEVLFDFLNIDLLSDPYYIAFWNFF